ncbi:hypothetical protein ACGF0D_09315 [Kitasatospora sp. NPDC048298]|uniref:hypothetical protein n=1 Tax=Kitasatospora sp. NPDC048298 TaxID=3364049 RepID=UPI00371F209A
MGDVMPVREGESRLVGPVGEPSSGLAGAEAPQRLHVPGNVLRREQVHVFGGVACQEFIDGVMGADLVQCFKQAEDAGVGDVGLAGWLAAHQQFDRFAGLGVVKGRQFVRLSVRSALCAVSDDSQVPVLFPVRS